MKSSLIRTPGSAKRRAAVVALAIVVAALTSRVAFASSASFSLDSDTSSARFFQGSRTNPDSVNTGVAHVTGKVQLDTNDLNNSVVDLNIIPANEDWGHALGTEDTLPANYVPDATDHTLLTFQSKRIVSSGSKLEVIGNLTLTSVERSLTLAPGSAYAGQVYGDPVIHTETREISFLLANPIATLPPGSSTSLTVRKNGAIDLSGSVRIAYEDFPGLLNAMQRTNWPDVVQNERCDMPSTIGEDYDGATCTGTMIATTREDNCQMPATVGENYSGPVCTPPAGTQTTIVLDLKLLQTASESSATTVSASRMSR